MRGQVEGESFWFCPELTRGSRDLGVLNLSKSHGHWAKGTTKERGPRREPRKSHGSWDSRVLPALLRKRDAFPSIHLGIV